MVGALVNSDLPVENSMRLRTKGVSILVDTGDPIEISKLTWEVTSVAKKRTWKDGTTLMLMKTATGHRWCKVFWKR